ncbi:signal peptidase I [Actinomyces sp. ZJ308]|uniref:signal peptidase I n=1 Tax=Actinomyces sp. ZJ308 TaxID=2708342 RepID=UPI00141DF971|nr:signal peptidase I [Actinomyces sp. ZJ308]
MRSAQDEADDVDDVGLDLKQAVPSQIGRASRSAVTPSCSAPSADSPQEADESREAEEGPSTPVPVDDSAEWDYDPFIDPDADPEPDDESVELPPSIQPRRHVAPAIPPPETSSPLQRLTRALLVLAVIILVPALLRTFVVQTYEIPSGSMENTLRDGDQVAVTMFDSDHIDRGDIIVFSDPDDWLHVKEPTGLRGVVQKTFVALHLLPEHTGHHLIKRVIGVGGDHVVADGKGRLSVNGVVITEDYVKDGQSPSLTSFDITVPQGYVWVMGDNRGNSADSRYHRDDAHGGFVPLTNVVGVAKAVFSWTSLSRWGSLGGGDRAFSQVPAHDTSVPSPAPSPGPPSPSTAPGNGRTAPEAATHSSSEDEDGSTTDGPRSDTGEANDGSEHTGPGRISSDSGAAGEDTEPGTSGDGRSDTGDAGADSQSSASRSGGSGTDMGRTR